MDLDPTTSRLAHLNLTEFLRETARWSGRAGRVEEVDGVLLFATASPFPAVFNGAMPIDPTVAAPDLLDTAEAWFGALGRGFAVWSDDAGHSDPTLASECESRGYMLVSGSPEMLALRRLPDEDPPPDVELRWVDDRATFEAFVHVGDTAFASLGLPLGTTPEAITDLRAFTEPHVQSVVAFVDDRPVAAAQTILSHGCAGVYWVGTVPEGRGRGLGEAVTRAVTNRAFDLGARFNSLQASPMGAPIYARMGYETVYTYTNFLHLG